MFEIAGGILIAVLIIVCVCYSARILFWIFMFILAVYIFSPRFSCDFRGLPYNYDTRSCEVVK